MNRSQLHELCGSFPGASLDHPFGPETDAWKVGGKLFAIVFAGDDPVQCNLKCDPWLAPQLRDDHPDAILPGYHMNKRHWNTVHVDLLDDDLVTSLVEDSYDLVLDGLPRSRRPAST